MNDMVKIININAYIQRGLGKITLDDKEVLCIALDRMCTFKGSSIGNDVELDDDQLEGLFNQTIFSVTLNEIGNTSSHNPLSGTSQEQLYRKKFFTPSEVVE